MIITTWDSTLTDVCVPISTKAPLVAKFHKFLTDKGIVFDNKTYVDDPTFTEIFGVHFIENRSGFGPLISASKRLLKLTNGVQVEVGTGGSTSNLGATFMKAMKVADQDVQFNYVTINASDQYGRANRAFLENAGLTVWPQNLPDDRVPSVSSISIAYILNLVTTYATHDTGVKQAMREAYVTKKMVDDSDMIIMPLSSARKFGIEFFNHTRQLQEVRNNYLIAVAPSGERAAREHAALSREMMLLADGFAGNYVEIGATLIPEKTSKEIRPCEVAEAVQKQLRLGHRITGRRLWQGQQFVLMSKGKLGASIILADDIISEDAVAPRQGISSGGSGDNLTGMVTASLARGMSWRDSLEMGVLGATTKIENTLTSVQEDPVGAVRGRNPELVGRFMTGRERAALTPVFAG